MTSTASPSTSEETSRDACVREVPSWLATPERYEPPADRDRFIAQSALGISSALARLRLEGGAASPLSPSAPTKLALALACVLLVSLARNFLFVAVLLAFVLVRAALLPAPVLRRVASLACAAAGLTLVVMAPSALLGQPRAALTLAAKALVSTALLMEATLTTPSAELTGALRALRVPNLVILTMDLALRSIVRLGEVSLEALTALRLRSVGHNRDKAGSLGGVGGVVFVKAAGAAQATHDAMRCRGFEGSYEAPATLHHTRADALWLCAFALLLVLFVHLQGQV